MRLFIYTVIAVLIAGTVEAQSEPASTQATAENQTTPRPPTPAKPAGPPQEPNVRARIARWFELQNTTLNLRYRYIDTSAGRTTTNQLQHRETIRGRVKFDKSGKYTWNFAYSPARVHQRLG